MRQNPRWILLSEVRSAEAVMAVRDSISSGHNILSTIHADKAESIPSRLYSLLESSIDMDQFLRSIHRYVQLGVHIKGYYSAELQRFKREVAEVVEFYVTDDNKPGYRILYKRTPDGNTIINNPSKYLLDYLESQGVIMEPDILVKEQFHEPTSDDVNTTNNNVNNTNINNKLNTNISTNSNNASNNISSNNGVNNVNAQVSTMNVNSNTNNVTGVVNNVSNNTNMGNINNISSINNNLNTNRVATVANSVNTNGFSSQNNINSSYNNVNLQNNNLNSNSELKKNDSSNVNLANSNNLLYNVVNNSGG